MSLTGDALLAVRLFARSPKRFGGLWVRGESAELMTALAALVRLRRLPLTIDDDRLIGGIDLGASLAAGRPVRCAGLLDEAREQVLVVHGAERISEALAGRLAQAMDEGGPAIVLLDEGGEGEAPPAALTDRVAFHLHGNGAPTEPGEGATPGAVSEEDIATLAGLSVALGVNSARALSFALAAAAEVGVTAAARLVLAPRATRMPAEPDSEAAPSAEAEHPQDGATAPEDVVLAAIRPHLLPELIAACAARSRSRAGARGQGARKRGLAHGRPVGARAAVPAGGLRLALVDTLRAAAPWQGVRGRGAGQLRLRKDDLRVRRFEDRETVLTVFAVDASGSAAFARLAEAKGAVELMLERAYARRAEVALIAFRRTAAELLLPPTRSLARARKLLADMPGGGATPLAAGLDAALALAEAGRLRGRTAQLVVLTDGRGNVAVSGAQSRSEGTADAMAAARRIAAAGITTTVLDISARTQPEASALAEAMRARLVNLPRAGAAGLAAAAAG